jgi:hypothetical protein
VKEQKMKMKRTACIIGAALLMVGASALSASADPSASNGGSAAPGYNAIPAHVSGNVPSVSFQASKTTEFGDAVGLSGSGRTLGSMTVLFSSWACQSGAWESGNCATTPGATFDVPITFNVYAADSAGVPVALLTTLTQTETFAYRPSASPLCTGGRWYNKTDKTCYNGFPQTVTMAMPTGVTLTDNVVWSVKYDTYNTNGDTGPVNSLNVGTFSFPNAPFSGTDLNEDVVFRNGALESGWTGLRPLGQITTQG